MKVIAGLGNPGKQYEKTRHNVGFMLSQFLAKKLSSDSSFVKSEKFAANICEINGETEKYFVIEPQNYMNTSGESISKVTNFYKVLPENVVVTHDDLDIPFGKFKVQKGTGPKQHNGISSIEEHLGTKSFWRIRIGVENRSPENYISGEAYVLNDFNYTELQELPVIFEKIYQQLKDQKIL